MRIQHNIAALNANRMLGVNNDKVSKNLEKLSSGYKINRAGDDAAGLAISEKMRGQIRGLDQATNNANDGISLVQTAEGALNETASILQRMKELATQSSNGTYQNDVDRENISKEVESLKSEIDRISTSTNFNKINLLDGSLGGGKAGVVGTTTATATSFTSAVKVTASGLTAGTTVNVNATAATNGVTWNAATSTLDINVAKGATLTQEGLNSALVSAGVPTGAKITLGADLTGGASADGTYKLSMVVANAVKDSYSNTVNGQKVTLTADSAGAATNTFTVANNATTTGASVDGTGAVTLNLDKDTQFTADDVNKILNGVGVKYTMSFTGSLTGTQIGDAMTTSTTHTAGAGIAGDGIKFQIGASGTSDQQVSLNVSDMSSNGLGLANVSVATQDDALAAIDSIDNAINTVSGTRADLGALQNRLEHTVSNLGVTSENLTSAESRIRDVDMAKEMMDMTKNNVLAQAAQSMLAQANQQPQNVLKLLQ